MFEPGAAPPAPTARDEERDLGGAATSESGQPEPVAIAACPVPQHMSEVKFKQDHPQVEVTLNLNMGSSITCYVVGGKVFIQSSTTVLLPGVASENSKPIFLYAGGSWISESAKAPR